MLIKHKQRRQVAAFIKATVWLNYFKSSVSS
jgi:hypothetical protein